jgi:hypothetical protein
MHGATINIDVVLVDVNQVCYVELLSAPESLGHLLSFLSVIVLAVKFCGPRVNHEHD